MNLTNYHSHCNFCDGRADMETFVRFAISQGFTAYGFSSHAPLPFDTSWTLYREEMDCYVSEFERLKKKYAGRIELFLGLEIDYLDEENNAASDYFQQLPLDYRIGSVHLLPDYDGNWVDVDVSASKFQEVVDEHFQKDLEYVICLYLRQLRGMLKAGGFDVVGHADKMTYNAAQCYTSHPHLFEQTWFEEAMDNYLSEIAKRDYIVELNTKAYLDKGVFFPNQRYLKRLHELGVRMTVNSDAHYPDKINAGRKEGLRALHSAGFDTVAELHEGGWRQVKIKR